jgi:hypothetical protein
VNATSATTEVLELVRPWAEAEQHNDADHRDAPLAADPVAVGSRGFVLAKDQWLARYPTSTLRNAARAEGSAGRRPRRSSRRGRATAPAARLRRTRLVA